MGCGVRWWAALVVLGCCSLAAALNDGEKTALKELFVATNGQQWKHNENWLVGDPCFVQWWGVTCSDRGHVTRIFLKNNNLNGTLPESFTLLTYLEDVDMTSNYINGPLPSSIGNLASLRKLILIQNMITGPIPIGLGFLVNLKELLLYDNWIFTELPSTIGGMKSLEMLDFGFNVLNGTLPSSISQLTSLKYIDLELNELSGPLPDMSQLKQLEELHLNYNNFNDSIPPSVASASKLKLIELSGNELSGPFPTDVYLLPNLERLSLDSNRLSGSLPSEVAGMGRLEGLFLQSNQFTGTIPEAIGSMKSLSAISLADNGFQTPLPTFLQSEPRIWVDLRNNNLTCPLPSWCTRPPTGNGRCEPCSLASEQILCCTYQVQGGTDRTSICALETCPDVVGLDLFSAVPVADCVKCVTDRQRQRQQHSDKPPKKDALRLMAKHRSARYERTSASVHVQQGVH